MHAHIKVSNLSFSLFRKKKKKETNISMESTSKDQEKD